ncbi:hypothetical protein [Pasteuria penetrans]|uniref:hypothetical protein n=1 Tax=Pasteuria penetrans TaxID=86005 RepID=UPI000F984AF9|nr:hypothetical protein [Pasteuria penetrans]
MRVNIIIKNFHGNSNKRWLNKSGVDGIWPGLSKQCNGAVRTISRWVKEDERVRWPVHFPHPRAGGRYPLVCCPSLPLRSLLQREIDDIKGLLDRKELEIS